MTTRDWAGAVALVLAVAVGGAFCSTMIIIALDSKIDSTVLTEAITTLGGASIGAVAGWLGALRTGGSGNQKGPGGGS
ncbi:MAG: hypothetical protein LBV78_02210 [Kitasatospora sp.]|jgi:hypothetical protein|nr:hypothetical protein [Kitasatospora sp.]